ncbi:MAG: helix-turn-helix transcriptional regulator [Clostridium sp.]|nr:helix-turn-helix transcriptional regulator [Clostridium sp.]
MNIGSKLKEARLDLDLKLKDVSKASNLSLSYISDIENNKSIPPLLTLQTLCNVLDIELYDLFKNDHVITLKTSQDNKTLHNLLLDFETWPQADKDELISYLNVKRQAREEARNSTTPN